MPPSHPSSCSPAAAPYRFHLLGELRISRHGERVPAPPYRSHTLLATLLLHPRPWHRPHLVATLFPDSPEREGRRRLSDLLWLLRRHLPGLGLIASAEEVRLPAASRWLDVEAFLDAAAQEDLESWLKGLALYEGDLLDGSYDEPLLYARESLHLAYIRLAFRAAEALLRLRRFGELAPLAERLVRAEPYDEAALRLLMRAYQGAGRRGAALAAYERYLGVAADELGTSPEAATQALAQAIRAGTVPFQSVDSRVAEITKPQAVLDLVHQAILRGERDTAEEGLHRLEELTSPKAEALLARIDLALLYGELGRAGQMLLADPPEADMAQEAALHARRAQWLLQRHAIAQASEAALEALLRAQEAGEGEAELAALLVLAQTHIHSEQGVQAMRAADQALLLARRAASPRWTAEALIVRARAHLRQGQHDQALADLHEAQALALEHGLRVHLATALHVIGLAQCHTNSLRNALSAIQEALALWRDMALERQEEAALECLALALDLLGRSAESLRAMDQALEISRRLGDPLRLATAQYNMACSLLYADDAQAPRTIALVAEALAAFERHGRPDLEIPALTMLGYARWIAGEPDQALAALREAQAACERVGQMARLPELLAYQGLAQLDLEHPRQALQLTRQAVLALAQGEVSHEIIPDVYYAHAAALLATGQPEEAQGYIRRAYQVLLDGAAQFQEDEARRAFFHHNPTLRRLMQQVYALGLAPAPATSAVSRQIPAAASTSHSIRVQWTVDAGPADAALKQSQGGIALRRARLSRLLREAEEQGASPTVGDLAAALQVSDRTIQRDLAALRDATA